MMGMEGNDQEGAMDEDEELARAIALSRETAERDRENDEKAKEASNSMEVEKKPAQETPKEPATVCFDKLGTPIAAVFHISRTPPLLI